MKFVITWPAEPDTRFAQTAFDRNVGKVVPVGTPTGIVDGTLIGARVADDGSSVDITIEVGLDPTEES